MTVADELGIIIPGQPPPKPLIEGRPSMSNLPGGILSIMLKRDGMIEMAEAARGCRPISEFSEASIEAGREMLDIQRGLYKRVGDRIKALTIAQTWDDEEALRGTPFSLYPRRPHASAEELRRRYAGARANEQLVEHIDRNLDVEGWQEPPRRRKKWATPLSRRCPRPRTWGERVGAVEGFELVQEEVDDQVATRRRARQLRGYGEDSAQAENLSLLGGILEDAEMRAGDGRALVIGGKTRMKYAAQQHFAKRGTKKKRRKRR